VTPFLLVALNAHADPTLAPGITLDATIDETDEGPWVTGVGDLDGDGTDDLAAVTLHGHVSLYRGGPGLTGTADAVFVVPSSLTWRANHAGDLDADGLDDLLFEISWFEENDDGSHNQVGGAMVMTPAADTYEPLLTWQTGGLSHGAGDVDGDGYADLINGETVWPGTSDGPDIETPYGLSSVCGGGAETPARPPGDFDGDGYADLVLTDADYSYPEQWTGIVCIVHGGIAGPKGAIQIQPATPQPKAFFGLAPTAMGDGDGDGHADLLVGAKGEMAAYVFHGSTTGVDPTNETRIHSDANQWHNAFAEYPTGTGDVDGDGLADILLTLRPTGDQGIEGPLGFLYYGAVSGYEGAEPQQLSVPTWSGGQAVSDVNDDGYADALWDLDVYFGSCRRTWYADADGDGFGDPDQSADACEPPTSYVGGAGDCDDTEPQAWTDADEVCDGVDNDCDGSADEDATDATEWFPDGDGDGYTTASDPVVACTPPANYAAATEPDCDDADAAIHPDAEDTPGDGRDQDCDGADATPDTGDDISGPNTPEPGCSGCASPASGAWWLWALGALVLRRFR